MQKDAEGCKRRLLRKLEGCRMHPRCTKSCPYSIGASIERCKMMQVRIRVLIRIAKGCKRMQLDAKVVSKTVRGMH